MGANETRSATTQAPYKQGRSPSLRGQILRATVRHTAARPTQQHVASNSAREWRCGCETPALVRGKSTDRRRADKLPAATYPVEGVPDLLEARACPRLASC